MNILSFKIAINYYTWRARKTHFWQSVIVKGLTPWLSTINTTYRSLNDKLNFGSTRAIYLLRRQDDCRELAQMGFN